MAEIARRAGVVRATIYVRFPIREVLIEAVTERSSGEAVEMIAVAEPERGDPAEALQRVLIAAWRFLERYHALVALNTQLPQAELRRRHRPVLALLATVDRARPTHRRLPLRPTAAVAPLDAARAHPRRQRGAAGQAPCGHGDRVCLGRDRPRRARRERENRSGDKTARVRRKPVNSI
jgi:AcrR family transcriptional regulator